MQSKIAWCSITLNFQPVEIAKLMLGIAARQFDDPDVVRAAGRLLREVIDFHLGGKELRSRKVLREVHRGRISR